MNESVLDARMKNAIDELTGLILARFPSTSFSVEHDSEEDVVFVYATVDVDDPDEVMDCFLPRLRELREPQWLPLHIVPMRTPERRERLFAERANSRPPGRALL